MVNYTIVGWFESITKKDELIKRQFPKVYFASLALVLSVIIFLGDSPLFILMVGIYVLSFWNYLAFRVNKSKEPANKPSKAKVTPIERGTVN